ncbi:MAG: TolC family protein [Gemmatimonadetes bacterium]|nr:TolC family protein [Gemmatimonadota bacterium]MBI3567004.1 TolC family protein [Gemmatimonadota bacterium]
MRKLWCALLVLGSAGPVAAQSAASTALTVDEALDIARHNNPGYQIARNNRTRAELQLRSAFGAMLPQASTNLGASYRQGKQQFFGGVAFGATSDVLSSSWGLNFNAAISARSIETVRSSRAALDASDATLQDTENGLRNTVVQQYHFARQMQAQAELQDSLVGSNQLQLDLAKAKEGVGSATSLDVKRAEVALGQQQVNSLKAHNTADVELLRLYQFIGVPMPGPVTLTSAPPVTEPTFNLQQLIATARAENPALRARRYQVTQANADLRAARGDYLPSVSFNASLGGFTQQYKDNNYLVNQASSSVASSRANCFTTDSIRRGAGLSSIANQCSQIVFSPAAAQALRDQNNTFPFNFTSNPYNLSLGISLPLFDGFGREQRLQNQVATRNEAQLQSKQYELQLATDVTAAYTTLVVDYRTVKLLENNSQAARDALKLAEERYRVGLNSLVDLQQARADYETAQANLINASFEFHRAYSALETAVGRPLR